MQSDQFRRMLHEQKEIVETAVARLIDCNHLTGHQRTRLCSQLLRELSMSSRKIAMTVRHRSTELRKSRSQILISDNDNQIERPGRVSLVCETSLPVETEL